MDSKILAVDEHVLFLMGTIHRVLKAEKALKGAAVPADVVVTPRAISSDCGMVVRVARAHLPRALEALREGAIEYQRIFAETDGGFEELADPAPPSDPS